ncbi:MAG: hypothetical protein Q3976_08605 [Corynebacterium sp.]|nr:hypothetical protein [Corynebacterium sp.]
MAIGPIEIIVFLAAIAVIALIVWLIVWLVKRASSNKEISYIEDPNQRKYS